MPRRALRCMVEVNIQAVTCPGVWLTNRNDVYISMRVFNQLRQTLVSSPIFPLLFHEKFSFDKVFYSAFEPSHVAESLESCTILIELIQVSDIYQHGRLLAYYECNARDFLYPYPSYSTNYGTQDRNALMIRTIDFPGIAPKLEFSTRTTLEETNVVYDDVDLGLCSARQSRPRSRSRSRSRTPSRTLGYSQPTISSITRSRSVSPGLHRQLEALDLQESYPRLDDNRPPFVVRKVGKELIGRNPGIPGKDCYHGGKLRPLSSVRRYANDDMYWDYSYRPSSRLSQVMREAGTYPYRYSYYSDPDSDDLEVAQLTSTDYGVSRPRTTSPLLYRSSLSDRYDERPWSLAKSDLISTRVQRALQRNRSLERLDRLSTSPYTGLYRSSYY